MPYAPQFEPRAQRKLQEINRIDPRLAEEVLDALERLADSPTSLSVPISYPYLLGQKYQFEVALDGGVHHFAVTFRYNELRNEIHIATIDHVIE